MIAHLTFNGGKHAWLLSALIGSQGVWQDCNENWKLWCIRLLPFKAHNGRRTGQADWLDHYPDFPYLICMHTGTQNVGVTVKFSDRVTAQNIRIVSKVIKTAGCLCHLEFMNSTWKSGSCHLTHWSVQGQPLAWIWELDAHHQWFRPLQVHPTLCDAFYDTHEHRCKTMRTMYISHEQHH